MLQEFKQFAMRGMTLERVKADRHREAEAGYSLSASPVSA
ncbi:MAG: MscL family protein [Alphaproteobacteria bacterium]|nr:MscL family protein [Alphaproteobacteria bacterium]